MPVTIKDIAASLELDHSTVGYALSGKGTIKEETRERVLKAAEQMGYVPNRLARQMRVGQSRILGVIMPNVVMGYNELIQFMFRYAFQRGYELQIALTEFDEELERRAVQGLLESQVAGLVLKSRYHDWDQVPKRHPLRQAAKRGAPVIHYGSALSGSPFSSLSAPLSQGAMSLTNHLLDLGHRRLAVLVPAATLTGNLASLVNAIGCSLGDAGLDPKSVLVLNRPQSAPGEARESSLPFREDPDYHLHLGGLLSMAGIEDGRVFLRQVLEQEPRPTALLCQNEMTAIGVILEAQRLGVAIPGELAVAAMTRNMLTCLSPISLTTMDVPNSAAARMAVDFLLDRIEGRAAPGSARRLEYELVVGESTIGSPSAHKE